MDQKRINFLESLELAVGVKMRFPYGDIQISVEDLYNLDIKELQDMQPLLEYCNGISAYSDCYKDAQLTIFNYIKEQKEIKNNNTCVEMQNHSNDNKPKKKGIFEESFYETIKETLEGIPEKDLKLLEAIIEYKRS